jgi:hypothetical protein
VPAGDVLAQFLREVGRLAVALTSVLTELCRLLVATATLHRRPFVTRDTLIRQHSPLAVWQPQKQSLENRGAFAARATTAASWRHGGMAVARQL